ncbi:MAG: hypothetical protein N2037_08355 [Acidimicrobiales bacterium]|nr:hypothetical protein [Acidimicrobiales bacterium]
MGIRRTSMIGAIAGLISGTLITAALVATGHLRLPDREHQRDASAEFLLAWERARRATFVLEGEFSRTKPGGDTLRAPRFEVQRPPDHLIKQFGGITGVLNGRTISCSQSPRGQMVCGADGPEATPFDERLERELTNLRSYFDPARPLYAVRPDGKHCFRLQQIAIYPDPPYGLLARFCFDEATGALRGVERHFESGMVERMEAVSLRSEVTQSDFDLEAATDVAVFDSGDDPQVLTEGGLAVPPTTAREESPTPLRDISDGELFDRLARVAPSDELDPESSEAIRRMFTTRSFGVNDPRWLGPDGQPTPGAIKVMRALLRQGYWLPPA